MNCDGGETVGVVVEAPGGGSGQKRPPESRVWESFRNVARAIITHRFALWAVTAHPKVETGRSLLATAQRTYCIWLMPWHTRWLKYLAAWIRHSSRSQFGFPIGV
jgi:hypothetical protein